MIRKQHKTSDRLFALCYAALFVMGTVAIAFYPWHQHPGAGDWIYYGASYVALVAWVIGTLVWFVEKKRTKL